MNEPLPEMLFRTVLLKDHLNNFSTNLADMQPHLSQIIITLKHFANITPH
jgi:hypothetical protein